jgi:hypothetical protein
LLAIPNLLVAVPVIASDIGAYPSPPSHWRHLDRAHAHTGLALGRERDRLLGDGRRDAYGDIPIAAKELMRACCWSASPKRGGVASCSAEP